MPARVRIGISGWRYAPWRGEFYPKGLRQADELRFAAERFSSIEINGSFYSLKTPKFYANAYAATPPDFVFALKASRYITHMLRLKNAETALANLFASGLLGLEDKLGPLLWQFPPTLAFDERFAAFFQRLPRDTREAAKLAYRHDERVKTAAFGSSVRRELRHAVEIRHPSFCVPSFIELLRREGIALVVADTAGHFPYLEDVTADFVYVRLHGDEEIYRSGYTPKAIAHWARRVRAWSRGRSPESPVLVSNVAPAERASRDVYVYFDNDVKVRAPFDAQALARATSQRVRRT